MKNIISQSKYDINSISDNYTGNFTQTKHCNRLSLNFFGGFSQSLDGRNISPVISGKFWASDYSKNNNRKMRCILISWVLDVYPSRLDLIGPSHKCLKYTNCQVFQTLQPTQNIIRSVKEIWPMHTCTCGLQCSSTQEKTLLDRSTKLAAETMESNVRKRFSIIVWN